jgi:hypothetical protein
MTPENDRETAGLEARRESAYDEWLTTRRENLERDRATYRRLAARWSWIRLLAFVAVVVVVILLRHHPSAAAGGGLAALAGFVAAILRHGIWESKRGFTERAITIVDESREARVQRDHPVRTWVRPADTMSRGVSLPTLIDPGPIWKLTEQERDDLDLYAPPVGIFGLLNRTSTDSGARRLRDMLDSPCLSCEHIRQRQQAVRWLDRQHEPRLRMMASLLLLRGQPKRLDDLIELLHHVERPARATASLGARAWSGASGPLVVWAVASILTGISAPIWARVLLAILAINSLLLIVFRPYRALVMPWIYLPRTLHGVLAVAEHARRALPDEGQLGKLKEHFDNIVSHGRIPSLCGWLEWAGLHGIVHSILNATVLLDLHVAEAVLARVVPNRDVLLRGLSAIADLEALCSLACFSAEQAVACYPQPAGDMGLVIEDGRHPLIPEMDAVANSIRLTAEHRTWMLTGPNAAGKSTFLRMVGVNVLLAQVGAAVPARRMTWTPARLVTDVRIRDDLALHESYFLSEVRRLRRMVLDVGDSAPVLGLIDEPFRGTNSQERTAAGIALFEHLAASNGFFLIASHEEMLARTAARTGSAENYHFQECLHDGGITFDYRLRPGPADTKTALRILEQEGYPKPLLDRARQLLTE